MGTEELGIESHPIKTRVEKARLRARPSITEACICKGQNGNNILGTSVNDLTGVCPQPLDLASHPTVSSSQQRNFPARELVGHNSCRNELPVAAIRTISKQLDSISSRL